MPQRLLFIAVLAMAACHRSAPTESRSYDDPALRDLVIKDLIEQRVPYTLEGNTLSYSNYDRDRVEAIEKSAFVRQPLPFGFDSAERRDRFVQRLTGKGIVAQKADFAASEEYLAYVTRAQYDEARGIYLKSLGIAVRPGSTLQPAAALPAAAPQAEVAVDGGAATPADAEPESAPESDPAAAP